MERAEKHAPTEETLELSTEVAFSGLNYARHRRKSPSALRVAAVWGEEVAGWIRGWEEIKRLKGWRNVYPGTYSRNPVSVHFRGDSHRAPFGRDREWLRARYLLCGMCQFRAISQRN